MVKMRKVILIILLALFTTGFEVQAAEVGVTDTTIKIATVIDEDGPIAFMGKMVRSGIEAVFRRVNDTGGIHGRKIRFLHESDGYNGPRAVAAVRKLIERDQVFCFVGNLGCLQQLAVYPMLEEKMIPLMFPACNSSSLYHPPRKYAFGYLGLRDDMAKVAVDYIVGGLKMKSDRIGYIGQEDVVYKAYYEGAVAQMKHYGMKFTAVEWYKRGAMDLSTQMLNLKKVDVDLILVGGLETQSAKITSEAVKLGWKPKFILDSGAADQKLIELAGKAAVEGVFAQKGYPLITSDAPGIINFKRDLKKYFPKEKPGGFNLAGYIIGTMFELALRDTGRNLTRENMVKTVESWNNRMTGFYPMTFGLNNRVGSKNSFMSVIKEGKYVRITDWMTPKAF